MTIVTDKSYKPATDVDDVSHSQSQSPDEPPPYLNAPADSNSSLDGPSRVDSTPTLPPIPKIATTNFINISRENNPVKGQYLIDIDLEIPKALLAPGVGDKDDQELDDASDRPNLRLESTHGSVTADVWLVGKPAGDSKRRQKRALIEVMSTHGSTRVQIVCDPKATPFALSASSKHGSVSIAIPRSFVGPIIMSTSYGSVRLSREVEAVLSTFSEVDGKRISFMGDFRNEGYGTGEWTGSTVELSSYYSSVNIEFIEEKEEAAREKERRKAEEPGFWARLFRGTTRPDHNAISS